MPVFRVQVFYKRGESGKWSNVWHANSLLIPPLLADFTGVAVPHLLDLLHPSATLLRYLVSDLAGNQFVSVEINSPGTAPIGTATLPLFNSVKALFNDGGLGRPDLKYLKGLLQENDQSDGELESAFQVSVDQELTALLSDMAAAQSPLCSREGNNYQSVSIQSAIQMRQMHRRRKRLVTPAP